MGRAEESRDAPVGAGRSKGMMGPKVEIRIEILEFDGQGNFVGRAVGSREVAIVDDAEVIGREAGSLAREVARAHVRGRAKMARMDRLGGVP